jgi:hypothetical protein
MRRSSDTIGAIATALAKAQAELSNPEKTLTATIPVRGGGPSAMPRWPVVWIWCGSASASMRSLSSRPRPWMRGRSC